MPRGTPSQAKGASSHAKGIPSVRPRGALLGQWGPQKVKGDSLASQGSPWQAKRGPLCYAISQGAPLTFQGGATHGNPLSGQEFPLSGQGGPQKAKWGPWQGKGSPGSQVGPPLLGQGGTSQAKGTSTFQY